MLRALARIGVFDEAEGPTFAITPVSDVLRDDHPRSLRWMAASMSDHAHWTPWGKAYETVVEGRCQTDRVLGGSPWEYLSGNPEEAGRFGQAMTNLSRAAVAGVVDSFDFSAYRHIVDVGGNHGTLLAAILDHSPEATGVLFDLSDVIAVAERELVHHPARRRMDLVGGSFFDEVPSGGDLYTMKYILHDWPDGDAARILRTTRDAMSDSSRLLVLDNVLTAEAPPFVAWLDVHMMVLQDGKERTADEFRELFERAGFALESITHTPGPVALVLARPV